MMGRFTHVQSIAEVAKTIGEHLIEVVSANSDNIGYGEMIWFDDGSEDGVKTFTNRGIECLKELLADIRTWNGGILGFLHDQKCDPDLIKRSIADKKNPISPD